jgi:RNA polymerase sigma factor for flagellar operon FliA
MSVSVVPQSERAELGEKAEDRDSDIEVVSSRERSDDSGIRRLPANGLLADDAEEGTEELPPRVEIPEDRLELMRADRVLFARYSPVVRRIALRTVRSLPRTLTVDDIISAGWVGMAEAMRRRPEGMPEEQFEAYASYRIRGAILDYLRALDPLSRKLRNAARRIAAATRALTQRLGRAPTDDEIARELGVSLDDYHQTLSDIQDAGFDRVDGVGPVEPQATSPSPEQLASKSELVCNVADAVEGLPERLQIVLGLHYQQECSLREIGEILGVTESRVCQLHSEALQRLRARLEGRSTRPRRRRISA